MNTRTCSGGGSRGVRWTLCGTLVVVLFSVLVFSNAGCAGSKVVTWADLWLARMLQAVESPAIFSFLQAGLLFCEML